MTEEVSALLPADTVHTMSYYLVTDTEGVLLGAFWLGDHDMVCGFLPVLEAADTTAAAEWISRAEEAMGTDAYGRDAFPAWHDAPGEAYVVGPVLAAENMAKMCAAVREPDAESEPEESS